MIFLSWDEQVFIFGERHMKISKLLNNNVAVVIENNEEKIVMGRGICFKKKVGDFIDPKQVDKVFFLEDQEVSRRFKELVVNIPLEYLQIGDEIFDEAKMTLGKPINDNCYIALVDHIKDKTGIELNDDEAGFIALHIVNGQLDEDCHDMYEITKIMQEIENIVRYHFKVEFNEDSAYYYRFVTHLKFFAQRLLEHKTQDSQEDDLLSVVQVKYANAYQCVEKIAQFILKQYDYELSDEEKLYLTIHIHRVVYLGNSR